MAKRLGNPAFQTRGRDVVRKPEPGASDGLAPNTVDFSHHCVLPSRLPALGAFGEARLKAKVVFVTLSLGNDVAG